MVFLLLTKLAVRSSGSNEIKGRAGIFIVAAIALLFINAPDTYGQNTGSKPTRQSSLAAFSKGDYEKAYAEFTELLVSFPKDPLYKYYSGVCLVNLKRDPEQAVNLLKQAQVSAALMKSVPADVIFWLARAQQLAGMYDEAVASYNSFTSQAGRKAARDLSVPEFIEQCLEKKGSLSKTMVSPFSPAGKPVAENITSGSAMLAVNYDSTLNEALLIQAHADSVSKVAEIRKTQLDKASPAERSKLKSELTIATNKADSLQKLADIRFKEAQEAMNAELFAEERMDISLPVDTPGKIADAEPEPGTTTETRVIPAEPEKEILKDSVRVPGTVPQKVITSTVEEKAGTGKPEVTLPVDLQSNKIAVYSYFESGSVEVADKKIEINPDIPPGLIYRIQVAVFRNPVVPSYFKGIRPVFGFKAAGAELTTYYAGMFRKRSDAERALLAVRKKGFKDAFVASMFEGRTVSPERALLLEKEWGKKPFNTSAEEKPGTPKDTIPPTLSFRVEALRSVKPVKDDVVSTMRRLAGSRGLDIVSLPDGSQVFLIGRFITYESADEYADLLVRNGYREAKVSAWLGLKEIPLDTARRLFENLEE